MTAYYQQIDVGSEIFDLKLDDSGRAQFGFNILAVKRDSAVLIDELVAILVAASVGVYGTTIFATSKAVIPVTEAGTSTALLSIRETGGIAPRKTQNKISPPAYQRPGAQIVVRSHDPAAARAMAYAAYVALGAIRNQTITA